MPSSRNGDGLDRLPGRVLFLSQDPDKVQRQIHGEDLTLQAALPLRDGVSVDEIAPTWVCYYFGERLEDFPYLGLACGGSYPFAEGSVVRGGFQVVVSGLRHGSQGFREAALFAEFAAGIRLVMARSFDPVYRSIARTWACSPAPTSASWNPCGGASPCPWNWFTRGQDPLTAEIIRSGGLFGYTLARMALAANRPCLTHRGPDPGSRTRAAGPHDPGREDPGPGGGHGPGLALRGHGRPARRGPWGRPAGARRLALLPRDRHQPGRRHAGHVPGRAGALPDPARILAFRDHFCLVGRFPAPTGPARLPGSGPAAAGVPGRLLRRPRHPPARGSAGGPAEGISHVVMAEHYVLPGQVVLGTDAHACHSGALGALAFGVDAADMANAWVTGDVRITVPPTCLVRLGGQAAARSARQGPGAAPADPPGPARRAGWRAHPGVPGRGPGGPGHRRAGHPHQHGPGVRGPDRAHRPGRRRPCGSSGSGEASTWSLEPWMRSDPDAVYALVVEVDCGQVVPMVAAPGDPGNALAVDRLERDVPVDIAYVGSCTGGKREDIERVHEVVRWALDRGLTLPLQVQLFIQLGSEDVRRHAEAQGWLSAFEEAGARVISPGCGACIHAGPGVSTRPEQVTIGAFNRNFPGRSGPGSVWLASPATVAASAFMGRIATFQDLRAAVGP